MPTFTQFNLRNHPAFGQWYARANRHPAWVTRTSLLVGILVIVIPLVLLMIAAVLIGGIVFLVLSLVARIGDLFGGTLAPRTDDGRDNVRVIHRH